MIETKTTFVLGAGASSPFGFPLGSMLTAQICEHEPQQSLMTVLGAWLKADEYSKDDVKQFVYAFERSGMSSIDAFLERQTRFAEIGKLAIAALLCRREIPDLAFRHDIDGNWYRALWREMTAGADSPIAAIRNVKFVTFNYDRSLEHFFFTAFQNTFAEVTAEFALRLLDRLGILHVYGAIGKFSPTADVAQAERPYTSDNTMEVISAASTGIRLIPEGRDDAAEFEKAREYFHWADNIVFLGFGFDDTNMRRLNLESVLIERINKRNERSLPTIFMSTRGKTDAQIARIKSSLLGEAKMISAYSQSKSCLETLAEFALIS